MGLVIGGIAGGGTNPHSPEMCGLNSAEVMLSPPGANSEISLPLVENRYGGDFPQCCCVDKAYLVSTVAAITEVVIITDNPRNNTRYVITTA
ncbi:hypothetical protein JWG39_05250 [Desulforhopalus vacuolatus]|uniref:hypothetical protein n=1 Tax=Desulforhopalus vacuolatus TaxID=40414 RepID=UPI0019630DA8|nr:hypothetical protein [Desulforhopalus vacuolatus]MBM9519226.1 hypothetical protein [Desulforhopalus vacuolatus]